MYIECRPHIYEVTVAECKGHMGAKVIWMLPSIGRNALHIRTYTYVYICLVFATLQNVNPCQELTTYIWVTRSRTISFVCVGLRHIELRVSINLV